MVVSTINYLYSRDMDSTNKKALKIISFKNPGIKSV